MDVTEMARLGGKARAAKLKTKERSEIARNAARVRWSKLGKSRQQESKCDNPK
jgi:hypothetical protein